MKKIIDGSNMVLGRLASYVAKESLKGEEIAIVNCSEVIITGNIKNIKEEFKEKRSRFGSSQKGPKHSRKGEKIVKRAIRGMLPYKQERGRSAYQRVLCYIGVPDGLKEAKKISLDNAHISKLKNENYLTVKTVSMHLRGK